MFGVNESFSFFLTKLTIEINTVFLYSLILFEKLNKGTSSSLVVVLFLNLKNKSILFLIAI
jgi:hypothetical protein